MFQRLKGLLGRASAKRQPMADGIYVSSLGTLHLSGDTAKLAFHTGARHVLHMSSAGGGISVSVSSLPWEGAEFKWSKEFPLVQATQANELFFATVAAWHQTLNGHAAAAGARPASTQRWPLFLAGVLAGAISLTLFGLMTTQSGAPSTAAAPGAPGAWTSPAGQPTAQGLPGGMSGAGATGTDPAQVAVNAARRLEQARLAPQELARLGAAHRIVIRAGDTPLVAFSDPNCPACQDLEREAASLKPGVGFTVVPVAFQPGSRVLAAKVLCAKDPARAWADALRGVTPSGQACEAGLAKVDENNDLFSTLGASATPTLIAGNGQLAQGGAPAAQLDLFATTYAR